LLLEDFESAIEEYGADLEDWPDRLRLKAQALLGTSSEARTLLEDEIRLDAAMFAAQARPIAAPAGLTDRIVLKALDLSPPPQAVPVRPANAPLRLTVLQQAARWAQEQSSGMALRYAAMLLVCFAMGLATSQFLQPEQGDEANPYYVASLYADLAY
jgi:hypothetical protein